MIVYGRNAVHEAIRGPRTVSRVWATQHAAREPDQILDRPVVAQPERQALPARTATGLEQRPDQRRIAQSADQERLQRLLQEWGEYEQAPNPVNDTRNSREQFDRNADRSPQP